MEIYVVKPGDIIRLGAFSVEFIHVNHSIADACALAIRTPCGLILHMGDFKIDVSPINGEMIDIARLGEIGRDGIDNRSKASRRCGGEQIRRQRIYGVCL